MIYACGCENATDAASGVLRCLRKCPAHRAAARDPSSLGEDYYRELGCLGGPPHAAELAEALGPIPPAAGASLALEVGCGVSAYAPALLAAGHSYLGVEASAWAAAETGRRHGVPVAHSRFEAFCPPVRAALILAAHCLEHLADAPGALRKMASWLTPGGMLLVVVPDDSDPTNPDHLWFFTPQTLWRATGAAGLTAETVEIYRRVPHERFIYLRARKS